MQGMHARGGGSLSRKGCVKIEEKRVCGLWTGKIAGDKVGGKRWWFTAMDREAEPCSSPAGQKWLYISQQSATCKHKSATKQTAAVLVHGSRPTPKSWSLLITVTFTNICLEYEYDTSEMWLRVWEGQNTASGSECSQFTGTWKYQSRTYRWNSYPLCKSLHCSMHPHINPQSFPGLQLVFKVRQNQSIKKIFFTFYCFQKAYEHGWQIH